MDESTVGYGDTSEWESPAEGADRTLDASRLREPLRSLKLRPPVRVQIGSRLGEAIRGMRDAGVGSCLVEDAQGRLKGIFTERDLLRRVSLSGARLDELAIDAMMQPDPETLTPEHPIAYALNRMGCGGYRNVPLVDADGKAVGLVTLRDIVDDLVQHFGDEIYTLPPTRRSATPRHREGA